MKFPHIGFASPADMVCRGCGAQAPLPNTKGVLLDQWITETNTFIEQHKECGTHGRQEQD